MLKLVGYGGNGLPQYITVPDTAPPPPPVIYGSGSAPQPIITAPPVVPTIPLPPPPPAPIIVYGSGSNPVPIVIPAPQDIPTWLQPVPPPPVQLPPPEVYPASPVAGTSYLDGANNDYLRVRDALISKSGEYYLILQTDGNVVVYKGKYIPGTAGNGTDVGGPALQVLWSMHNAVDFKLGDLPLPFKELRMQSNGDLGVYRNFGDPLGSGISWTHSAGTHGQYFVMQDDGNAVLYTSQGQAIWDTFGTFDKNVLTQIGQAFVGGVQAFAGAITGNGGAVVGGIGNIAGAKDAGGQGPKAPIVLDLPPRDVPKTADPIATAGVGGIASEIGSNASGIIAGGSISKTQMIVGFVVLLILWILIGDD